MTDFNNKLLGGFYGAILGDACGVPYEFKTPLEIPLRAQITFTEPVPRYDKTYPDVPYGTWSDDTSLILCLLDSIVGNNTAEWSSKFIDNMIHWRYNGLFAVDGKKFDIGIQTANALSELESGVNIADRDDPNQYSNGALMRSIVPALCGSTDRTVEYLSRIHVRATHANNLCIAVSMVYSMMGYYLLKYNIITLDDALQEALIYVRELGSFNDGLDILIEGKDKARTGSGYVVDSFWSAYDALKKSTNFKSTIQHAIAYGNDTDTTACIAGGLAGIIYGYDQLPKDWLEALRGKNVLQTYAQKLQLFHNDEPN